MIIYVDIDETICMTPPSRDYRQTIPVPERITKINTLYDAGHTIVYWTARGTVTGIDWREVTEQQFRQWGVKYHELRLGKPSYHLFICDKAIHTDSFFAQDSDSTLSYEALISSPTGS